ncbi:putative protein YEL023C [Talaromyces islandicus]|uniref:T6SS Phospholipase effector Tle1-like catalytic domain-containing protein n=1 Tax=Talaromyces islandicus TaxID=28573 RepID=A0A0U1MA88_TALIS|nr:putative protein YEL023C [Talaromyces islandicus]
MEPLVGPQPPPKVFVLCFDGTGNKFSGDESDSNVLKIFRMLDRSRGTQFHYYQPGIGTYVTSSSLSSTGTIHRIRSAYLKAKDSAIGSSFDQHVMGGYKFLMRYYVPGDDIYFFGFSRGSYIARFLAEMLDYIGLLEAGNEELIRFAWKTFAKWQQRRGHTENDEEEKKKLFNYMKAFRETFSRPISRIRFMGLFDTVNSVPRFESAWMQRSKFPYTARSSARVIRHAVGIDERRAKFRQDLISETKPWHQRHKHHENYLRRHIHLHHEKPEEVPKITLNNEAEGVKVGNSEEEPAKATHRRGREESESVYRTPRGSSAGSSRNPERYRAPSPARNVSQNLIVPDVNASNEDISSVHSDAASLQVPQLGLWGPEDEEDQDIREVWFPGGHADIGGGWKLEKDEQWPLSHAPLVWMVQEAIKAGLGFDAKKLKQFECCEDYVGQYSPIRELEEPEWCLDESHKPSQNGVDEITIKLPEDSTEVDWKTNKSVHRFRSALEYSSTKGKLHDCLQYGEGLPWSSVLSWRIMEYLPFRRMDLQPDGSWKPIRWPLPCGEVRDIPTGAEIHISAIRRLKYDPTYRPGNLIIGGGGRGIRRASAEHGIGKWLPNSDEGDVVRATYVRQIETKKAENGVEKEKK